MTAGPGTPVTVVSADTHVGPLLQTQLRAYCPKKHLAKFDDYATRAEALVRADQSVPEHLVDMFIAGTGRSNLDAPGHYDINARLADMDGDGVAAEIVFHASENGQPIPFRPLSGHFGNPASEDRELAAVGSHIYNRWLADFCSAQPERHPGLAHLPIWHVAAAVKEVEWARNAGLRGVNFPAMRHDLPEYDKPDWEPLWSACEALSMPLTTHIGGATPAHFTGPHAMPLKMYEDGQILGYRAAHWMLFGGVFERHPGLKLVITEIAGDWWPAYLKSLDDVWTASRNYPGFRDQVPRPPSEYCSRQVYFGASFMAHFEAEAAVRDGYVDRVMWGSDYPHVEGTWQYAFDPALGSATRITLRNTFAGIPGDAVRSMAGETAINVYGLDRAKLAAVAARIAAPSLDELSSAPETLPPGLSNLALRTSGAWT